MDLIEDDYHMTTTYENMYWMKLTCVLSKKKILNLRTLFILHLTFTSRFVIAYLNVLTREN